MLLLGSDGTGFVLIQGSKERVMRARSIRGLIVLLTTTLLTHTLLAQTFRGTILGTVTDRSGAVVSGATVTAKNEATGLERTTQTGITGSYTIPELPLGTYSVRITQ